jgi:hypothetical protein
MNKRHEKDIWANMYALPVVETPAYISPGDVTELLQIKGFFRANIKMRFIPGKKVYPDAPAHPCAIYPDRKSIN